MDTPARDATPLPPIRQDLGLFPASPLADGSPAWNLHDPAGNRFYLIGWTAFEILSRWHLGTVEAVVAAVCRETTLPVEEDDVAAVVQFLERHQLLEARTARDSRRLLSLRQARKVHWARWLLKNYLFFRVPLVRPKSFLDKWAPRLDFVFLPAFWYGLGAAALLALGLVARHWDEFTHAFAAYGGWEAALAFGVALSFAKVAHELGHAITARRHGCEVPSMGVAFLVLWPVLYTDTNEAWKLPSRRARLQIGMAGVAAELVLAVAATFLWLILPEGPSRAAVFLLASTTWVLTLAINASPFMRFDGYFILSDLLGLPNLHSRAFALARWWLRERLFGLGLPAPEIHRPRLQRFLIAFAVLTWVYRLVLFLGIALLVYHLFFKALGIILLLVELGWFIAWPLLQEVEVWWQLRRGMKWNPATRRTALLASILAAGVVIPWPGEVSAPAMLAPAREQSLYVRSPSRVLAEPARGKTAVGEGEVLLQLESPDLDHQLALARQQEAVWRWQVEQQSFNDKLLLQGPAVRRHWEEAAARVAGLTAEAELLTVRAPFAGEIAARNDGLEPGSWVAPKEPLYAVADRRLANVDAYVAEQDLERLKPGSAARFVPDAPEFGTRRCRIAEIDRVNVAELEDPSLASVYGGPIAVQPSARGMNPPALLPTLGLYRVRLDQCDPAVAPRLRIRGVAQLDAEGRSLLLAGLEQVLRVLLRESGF